jgi:flagellar protein FliL
MATSATTDKGEQAKPSGGKKKKLMLIIVGLCVLLSAGGGGAWYFLKGKGHANDKDAAKEEHKAPPVFVNFEQFTVNLLDDGGDRYLQTEIVLQVSGNELVEPIKEQMPVLRSSILLLLSNKIASELTTKVGKSKLAEQIIAEIRMHLHSPALGKGVERVHFASFVIQ